MEGETRTRIGESLMTGDVHSNLPGEKYKKKPLRTMPGDILETPGSSSMTIDSLVHSNPTSPVTGNTFPGAYTGKLNQTPIDFYFTLPTVTYKTGWNSRSRSEVSDRSSAAMLAGGTEPGKHESMSFPMKLTNTTQLGPKKPKRPLSSGVT